MNIANIAPAFALSHGENGRSSKPSNAHILGLNGVF